MKRFSVSWRDVLTFALFFLLASSLWFGHAMHSVRNTRVPVLVSYTGAPNTIGWKAPGLPDTVMIEVRDAGQRLSTYIYEPLRLTIDLHPYLHSDRGTLRIPSDALRSSISNILQGTSRLIETTPEEIVCPYYTVQEKSVPLALECELTTASEYQLVGTPTLSRKRVKLYGQGAVLDGIDTIRTVLFNATELSDTTDMRVALALPQGTWADHDSVDVRIIAERYTEKKISVPVRVQGVPEGCHIRIFPTEVEVTVRMGMSHYAQVQPRDVSAVCVYTPERSDRLDVELRYKNPYITASWVYPGVVEFILEQQ